jgi:hypothetical protein
MNSEPASSPRDSRAATNMQGCLVLSIPEDVRNDRFPEVQLKESQQRPKKETKIPSTHELTYLGGAFIIDRVETNYMF